MDELLDILDSEGKPTGTTAMKSQAHRKGLWHPTIHVWLYTREGKLLIQQRAKNKDTHPLLWDVSVAGHVGAGEDIAISAVREVAEEIGLNIDIGDLEKIGTFKSFHRHHDQLIDCEFHHTFLCELKVPLSDLIKQESEVEALTLIALAQFSEDIRTANQKKFVPYDLSYHETVIKAVRERLP